MMWSLRLSVWRRISVNQSLNTWTVRCSEHSMCCRASVSLSALLPLMTSLPGLPPADWLSLCPDISFHFRRRWPALTGAESAGWAPSGVHLNKSACSRLISSSSFLLRSISSHVQSQRPSPCRCCWFFHFCSLTGESEVYWELLMSTSGNQSGENGNTQVVISTQ